MEIERIYLLFSCNEISFFSINWSAKSLILFDNILINIIPYLNTYIY